MNWFAAARRLRRLGVLGINGRNASFILNNNPRASFPSVDEKLRLQRLCMAIGVPTPAVYNVIDRFSQLRRLPAILSGLDDFVIKPNRGSAGRGIVVVAGRDGTAFRSPNGGVICDHDLQRHLADLMAGLFSLGGRPDVAIVQQRVRLHPVFAPIAHQGIPDVRVIVYRGEPAMAMLRLPTQASGGRANLHQGGIGVGVDIVTGRTIHAVCGNRALTVHPDTGASLVGTTVPVWKEVLTMARRVAEAVGMGYLGVDIVLDNRHGPLLLEANARPGLAIQLANAAGLRHRLDAIDAGLLEPFPAKLARQTA